MTGDILKNVVRDTLILVGVCMLIVAVVAIGTGYYAGYNDHRQEAIENNMARWIINEKTGEKSFEWRK